MKKMFDWSFDAMDDLSESAPSIELARAQEKAALEIAGRVWTGTSMMEERLRDKHPHVRFIPCGVEAERFVGPPAGA